MAKSCTAFVARNGATFAGRTHVRIAYHHNLSPCPDLPSFPSPGLVMPVFANSKSEMVAAGVIPIDRLTDIRAPVEVVAKRLGRWQLENCYGFKLPPVAPHEPPSTPPTALQLLRCGLGRAWDVGGAA